MNVKIVVHVGINLLKTLHTENTSHDISQPEILERDGSYQAQASSFKQQASSYRVSNFKQQASSPEQQASSFKPQATSSVIREPWNMDTEEVLGDKGPRAFIMIKELLG